LVSSDFRDRSVAAPLKRSGRLPLWPTALDFRARSGAAPFKPAPLIVIDGAAKNHFRGRSVAAPLDQVRAQPPVELRNDFRDRSVAAPLKPRRGAAAPARYSHISATD